MLTNKSEFFQSKYAHVMSELREGGRRSGIWAHALAEVMVEVPRVMGGIILFVGSRGMLR